MKVANYESSTLAKRLNFLKILIYSIFSSIYFSFKISSNFDFSITPRWQLSNEIIVAVLLLIAAENRAISPKCWPENNNLINFIFSLFYSFFFYECLWLKLCF
jgi:hypothetical protein